MKQYKVLTTSCCESSKLYYVQNNCVYLYVLFRSPPKKPVQLIMDQYWFMSLYDLVLCDRNIVECTINNIQRLFLQVLDQVVIRNVNDWVIF